MPHKKALLFWEILKNFCKIFTIGFWKTGFILGFPQCFYFWICSYFGFVKASIRDFISFVIIPDYPPDPDEIDYFGEIRRFDFKKQR